MNELTRYLTPQQMQDSSIDKLKDELTKTLTITSENLVYMAMLWQALTDKGVDLSHLNSGLMEYVPLIASKKLNAKLVVDFAGNRTLLTSLSKLPIQKQDVLAKNPVLPIIKLNNESGAENAEVSLFSATYSDLRQLFDADRGIRSLDEQYAWLLSKKKSKVKTEVRDTKKRKTYSKVAFDRTGKYIMLGDDSKILLETLLEKMSAELNIDVKGILSKHTNAIK